jgi:hypothetical protein
MRHTTFVHAFWVGFHDSSGSCRACITQPSPPGADRSNSIGHWSMRVTLGFAVAHAEPAVCAVVCFRVRIAATV